MTLRGRYLENPPPAACTLYDKAISITSMSKCYGIPGCRIGWLACKDQHERPPPLHAPTRDWQAARTHNQQAQLVKTDSWVVSRTDHHARAVSLPRSCWTRF